MFEREKDTENPCSMYSTHDTFLLLFNDRRVKDEISNTLSLKFSVPATVESLKKPFSLK